ncbi:MAG TPA: helix-turn-helix domain-containing protein [Stenotrophomonas sp.]
MTPPDSNSSNAQARAEAQRVRILDAAQRCFIARGFHAAAVSDIAAEAGISQGLMYRYFDNKRAMILALIQRQLEEDQRSIGQTPASLDMVDGLLACYQQWARGESIGDLDTAIANVGLYAEITAEAQRDPAVGTVLRKHDKLTTEAVCHWLREHDIARGAQVDEALLRERTLLLRVVVEGLAMRAVRDPDLAPETVRAVLLAAISRVLGA